ncbi:RrF2 family transcriptional regulator [Pseudoroseicyclus tamaricis]|uniref:Rrf2 family transcriptional regulator n=1 Tax=Pseudoroseicyclus tamaricis TaxID=2705421 RepID=A0A6B2JZR0_9RHOB|nr:Rrf2 family transcriptional regulator [Pseudoroseicyclus tamaricis]NDV02139.1 Rrf2 family transcriptional regulator [Pseudoroseicyclus tamaricis]
MLSQKARYALHAAIHLARAEEEDRAVTAAAIAAAEGIPAKYLEQILADLKRRGVVQGRRGPSGGYRLARAASDISFAEILRSVDGPLALAPCVSVTAPGRCPDCKSVEHCEIRPILEAVRHTTALLLEGMSLAEAAGGRQISFAAPPRETPEN